VDKKKATRQVEQVWRKKFEQRGLVYPEKNPPKAGSPVIGLDGSRSKT
jgi:hypothetical protein